MPLYHVTPTQTLGFIHMVKTGGSWVKETLRDHNWVSVGGGHDPAWYESSLPGTSLFGTVRDPWTWYCSLYRYSHLHTQGVLCLQTWGRGSNHFKDVLYGWTHLKEAQYPPIIGCVFAPVQGEEFAKAALKTSTVGFWSWTTAYFYGNGRALEDKDFHWKVNALIDMNNLEEDLSRLIGKPIALKADKNESAHIQTPMGNRPYQAWYDNEMIEWVREADGALATTLGYSEPR